MTLRGLFAGSANPGPTTIERGTDFQATQLWMSRGHGHSSHRIVVHAAHGSLFVSDGWGVSFASLRFRRLDLATGVEAASFRSGTAVRCMALSQDQNEVLAISDTKVFRLDALTLAERQRWDSRIPRYSDTMAVRRNLVVVANWLAPSVGVIDLANGRVRRRPVPEMTTVLDGKGDPLLVGGGTGGLFAIDPISCKSRTVIETPAALDASLSRDGNELWITVGQKAVPSASFRSGSDYGIVSVRGGAPTSELRRYTVDGSEAESRYRLPVAVHNVRAGRTKLWLFGERELLSVALPLGSKPARVWSPPADDAIVALDPDANLIITTRPDYQTQTAEITCLRASD